MFAQAYHRMADLQRRLVLFLFVTAIANFHKTQTSARQFDLDRIQEPGDERFALPANLVIDQKVKLLVLRIGRYPGMGVNTDRPRPALVAEVRPVDITGPRGVLKIAYDRVLLAKVWPFTWMGHQADARHDGIGPIVAVKRVAAAPEHPDAIILAQGPERGIDQIRNAEPVQAKPKIDEDLVNSARLPPTADRPAATRPDEPVTRQPAVAFRRIAVV